MNIVGIRTDNEKVFESNPINQDIENAAEEAEMAIKSDALAAKVGIRMEQMADDELSEYIDLH